MNSSPRSITTLRRLASLAALGLLALAFAPIARADVCVWRDPDRTMARLFPDARDYLTVTKKVTPAAARRIEEALGQPLDDSEKAEFNFYDLRARRGGKVTSLGTAMALAGKGEFGVIEVVIGLGPAGAIRAVYIQRSRERSNRIIRSPGFLGQFVGKTVRDPLEFGTDLNKPRGAEVAAVAVLLTIRKMLLFYQVLEGAKEER